MNAETIKNWYDMAWPLVSGALLGILILGAGWMVAKWAHKLVHGAATRARIKEALARFFATLARYVVLAATLIAALGAVGIPTTSLLTIFASAGLAIGLAMQGSLSNLAAGVMLLLYRPFDLDDAVKVAGEAGKVTDIGLFATTLLTPGNETIIVPNGAITSTVITNFTRMGDRRATVGIGVAYGTDADEVTRVLLAATRSVALVHAEPAPGVMLTGFGASSVDYTVVVWSKASDFLAVQDVVRRAIYKALNESGIEIPFPQVVVHPAQAPAPEV